MAHRKLFDFMMQTSSGTLGTIIGILLTLGTTYYQQQHEKEQMERTAALMVIHNLDRFCARLEFEVKKLEKADSLNYVVWHSRDINQIPEDTLRMFANNFMAFQVLPIDNTAENIFSTNIDTWKNIGSSEFVELAGKCFAAKNLLLKLHEEMSQYKLRMCDTLMIATTYNNHPTKSLREFATRVFESASLCSFITKQHEYYLRGMKGGLKMLKDKNERSKKLMHVTEEELKRFGDNESKDYTFNKNKEPVLN